MLHKYSITLEDMQTALSAVKIVKHPDNGLSVVSAVFFTRFFLFLLPCCPRHTSVFITQDWLILFDTLSIISVVCIDCRALYVGYFPRTSNGPAMSNFRDNGNG